MKPCLWMAISSAVCCSIWGQALSVSSPTAQPGKPVDVDLSFAGAGAAPTALQWTVTYPANDLTLVGSAPSAGAGLQAAGKSLACRGTWKKAPVTYSYRCIVSGGRNPVPDGIIATLHFQVKPSVKAGVRSVELDDASAATVETKKVQLGKTSGKLSVVAEAK